MVKLIVYILGGVLAGAIILSAKFNWENHKNRKYQEEKDLRRRGIDPKARKKGREEET